MIENYMDYSEGACMNIFTIKQKERMDIVLANSPNRPFDTDVPTICHPENLSTLAYSPQTVRSCGPMNIQFTNTLLESTATTSWGFSGINVFPTTSNQPQVTVSAKSSGILFIHLQTTFAGVMEEKTAQISVIILPVTDAICQTTACDDGVKNGNELGIDCGGSCAPCHIDCDKAAVYNGPISLPDTIRAAQLIESGNLTGAGEIQIEAGRQVTLEAQQILLQPGFIVNPNAGLEIIVGGCN